MIWFTCNLRSKKKPKLEEKEQKDIDESTRPNRRKNRKGRENPRDPSGQAPCAVQTLIIHRPQPSKPLCRIPRQWSPSVIQTPSQPQLVARSPKCPVKCSAISLSCQPPPPSGGKGKGGEMDKVGAKGGMGTPSLSAVHSPSGYPYRHPHSAPVSNDPSKPLTGIKCIACKPAKQPYEHNYMTFPLFWESEEAKKFQA